MQGWWLSIGEPSLWIGSVLGAIWAVLSTWRRRHRYMSRGLRPKAQIRWFLSALAGMGSYLTLVVAIGLLAIHDILPQEAVWYMLGAAALAFSSALLFGRFEEPRALTETAAIEVPQPAPKRTPAQLAAKEPGPVPEPAGQVPPAATVAGAAHA